MTTPYKKHLQILRDKLQAAKKQNPAHQDGSRLEHGIAHTQAHRKWSRRGFLKGLGIAGGMSMMLGKTSISAASPSPFLKALFAPIRWTYRGCEIFIEFNKRKTKRMIFTTNSR